MSRVAAAALLVCLLAPNIRAQAGNSSAVSASVATDPATLKSGPANDTQPIDGPVKGSNEWQVWGAAAFPFTVFENAPLARIYSLGGRYGRVLTDERGPSFLRGRLEYAFEVVPVMEVDLPRHSVYAPGFAPFVWDWDFVTRHRVSPYFEIYGGAVFGNHEVVPGTTSFNFMPSVASGVKLPFGHSGKYSWTLEARFFHISNAGLTDYNPGLNTVEIRVGFGQFTHPRR
jgi:hypothetical protein